MKYENSYRANLVRGLPVAVMVLLGGATGCGVDAPSSQDPTTTDDSVAEVQQETWMRHGHDDDGDGHQCWLPRLCGGRQHLTCSHGDLCLPILAKGCPGPGHVGLCVPRPHECPGVSNPVCGCDGKTYANLCEAAKAGSAVDHHGACAPPDPPPECTQTDPCARGEHFDSDPAVCACVPDAPDPCSRIACQTGMLCVAHPDGTATCEPLPN